MSDSEWYYVINNFTTILHIIWTFHTYFRRGAFTLALPTCLGTKNPPTKGSFPISSRAARFVAAGRAPNTTFFTPPCAFSWFLLCCNIIKNRLLPHAIFPPNSFLSRHLWSLVPVGHITTTTKQLLSNHQYPHFQTSALGPPMFTEVSMVFISSAKQIK